MEYKGYISHLNYTYEKITQSNESLAVVRARMSSEGDKITTLWRSVERTPWHDSGDQWRCPEHEHDIGHMSLVHFLVWHSDVKYLIGCCCCFHFTARVIRHCETRFADPGVSVTARYRFNRQIQWRQSSKGHNILTILTHLKFVLFPHNLTTLAHPYVLWYRNIASKKGFPAFYYSLSEEISKNSYYGGH